MHQPGLCWGSGLRQEGKGRRASDSTGEVRLAEGRHGRIPRVLSRKLGQTLRATGGRSVWAGGQGGQEDSAHCFTSLPPWLLLEATFRGLMCSSMSPVPPWEEAQCLPNATDGGGRGHQAPASPHHSPNDQAAFFSTKMVLLLQGLAWQSQGNSDPGEVQREARESHSSGANAAHQLTLNVTQSLGEIYFY